MKVIEKILYFAFIIGWIAVPDIVQNILESRNVTIPEDLMRRGVTLWYIIGGVQLFWAFRKNLGSSKVSKRISWQEKGQDDWLHRD